MAKIPIKVVTEAHETRNPPKPAPARKRKGKKHKGKKQKGKKHKGKRQKVKERKLYDWTIKIYRVGEGGATHARGLPWKAPFGLRERAWGEFRIHIIATPYGLSRADDVEIWHQLRLLKGKYEEVYPVCVKDPPPILLERLGMSHPVSAIRASVLKEVIAKQMLDEYQDKHAASNSTGKALSEFELGDLEAPVRKNVDTLGRKDALEWFKATHKGRLDAVRAECAKLACDELEDKLDDIFSDAMPSDSLAPLNHDTLLAQEVEYGVVDEASKLAGNAAE